MISSIDSGDSVVLRTYSDLNLARLHLTVLADEGIPAYLKDEFVNSVMPFYAFVTGGAKLVVQKEDEARAIAVLDRDYSEEMDAEGDLAYDDTDAVVDGEPAAALTHVPDACPQCGSHSLQRSTPLRRVLLAVYTAILVVTVFYFGIFFALVLGCLIWLGSRLLFPGDTWVCTDCDWRGN